MLRDQHGIVNIVDYASRKCRRVTHSSLAGEIMAFSAASDAPFFIKYDFEKILTPYKGDLILCEGPIPISEFFTTETSSVFLYPVWSSGFTARNVFGNGKTNHAQLWNRGFSGMEYFLDSIIGCRLSGRCISRLVKEVSGGLCTAVSPVGRLTLLCSEFKGYTIVEAVRNGTSLNGVAKKFISLLLVIHSRDTDECISIN